MPHHAEKRVLPYTPCQMFDLVADIDTYPQFLPWCLAAHIRQRQNNVLHADLVIGYKMLREKFGSRVTLDYQNMEIRVEYLSGPMRYLKNVWRFLPHQDGCLIDFDVDFEFRSVLLQRMMGLFFHEAVKRMVQAFEKRAASIYSTT
jgi:coenzyme Q-binding protein COQ10